MKTKITIFLFLIIILNVQSQGKMDEEYCIKNKIATVCFEFSEDSIFIRRVYSHMGLMFSEKGSYKINKDSIYMDYDYNYPEYDDDVKKQKFVILDEKTSDSSFITIKFHVRDVLNNFVLPETNIIIDDKIYQSDYDGNLTIKVVKKDEITLSANIDDSPPIFINLNGNNNYSIECIVDPDLKDLSKEYKYSYKFVQEEDYFKLIFVDKDGKIKKQKYKLNNL